jgi:hypothetical protein
VKIRWATLLLGVLLCLQGLGKLIAPRGYADALAGFQALPRSLLWPVAITWMTAELGCGALLVWAGVRRAPSRRVALGASIGAFVIQVGYAALTFSAFARGLHVGNCTCFGVFLAQRLSKWVLAQDLYMLGFTAWQARRWKLR